MIGTLFCKIRETTNESPWKNGYTSSLLGISKSSGEHSPFWEVCTTCCRNLKPFRCITEHWIYSKNCRNIKTIPFSYNSKFGEQQTHVISSVLAQYPSLRAPGRCNGGTCWYSASGQYCFGLALDGPLYRLLRKQSRELKGYQHHTVTPEDPWISESIRWTYLSTVQFQWPPQRSPSVIDWQGFTQIKNRKGNWSHCCWVQREMNSEREPSRKRKNWTRWNKTGFSSVGR